MSKSGMNDAHKQHFEIGMTVATRSAPSSRKLTMGQHV
jgi:hypothetical protein